MCSLSTKQINIIGQDPDFKMLVKKRSRLAWVTSGIILIFFYGFVLSVAFFPDLIGSKLFENGNVTVGVAAGIVQFFLFWFLTWFYVRKSNKELDVLRQNILKKVE